MSHKIKKFNQFLTESKNQKIMEDFNLNLKDELTNKFEEFENKFKTDPEVIELVDKLKDKFETFYNETFTQDEIESDEYDELTNEYYHRLRDDLDPDDATIFQVMWFK